MSRRSFFALFAALLIPAFGSDDLPQRHILELQQALRTTLPASWSVSYDTINHVVKITRNTPTLIDDVAPNDDGNDHGKIGNYQFNIDVSPLLTKASYARELRENNATEKEIEAAFRRLCESPTVMGIQRPHAPVVMPSAPYSSNPTDQPLIAEYNRLQSSLHDLPDGYFGHLSLSLVYPPLGWGPVARDPAIQKECDGVRAAISRVWSTY